MPLTRRYQPTHPEGDTVLIGIDFATVLAPGAALRDPDLAFWINWPGDVVPADADWEIDPLVGVQVAGRRRLLTRISGGVSGIDYQLRWSASDTLGNFWTRTALLLVGDTA